MRGTWRGNPWRSLLKTVPFLQLPHRIGTFSASRSHTFPTQSRRAAMALEALLAQVPVVVVAGPPGSGRSRLVRAIEPPPLVIDELPARPAAAAVLAAWLAAQLAGSWRSWRQGPRLVVVVAVTGGPVLEVLRHRLGWRLAVLTLRGPCADDRRPASRGGPLAPDPLRVAQALLQPALPGLWGTTRQEQRAWLRQRLAAGGLNDGRLHGLLPLLAASSGEPLARAALARATRLSPATLSAWLRQLEHLGLVIRLDPWPLRGAASHPPQRPPMPRRRLGRRPTWYLADAALQALLLDLEEPADLLASEHLERIWRTRLVQELVTLLGAAGLDPTGGASTGAAGGGSPGAAAGVSPGGWAVRVCSWSEQRRTLPLLMEIEGRYWLADSLFQSNPDWRHGRRLRRVAATLPAGRLMALTLVCPCAAPRVLDVAEIAARAALPADQRRPLLTVAPLSRLSEAWPVLQLLA